MGANLHRANLFRAVLSGAALDVANFQEANLFSADLQGTTLVGTDFQSANLAGADFREADLQATDLREAHARDIIYKKMKRSRGIRLNGCWGSPMFNRYAQDQDWLEEFLHTREGRWQKGWAWFWRESCDYGRSLGRWAFLSFLLAVVFGCIFYVLGPDAFDVENLPKYPSLRGIVSMIYYSVVTFTTLGFGDIVPKTIPGSHSGHVRSDPWLHHARWFDFDICQ